MGYIKYTWFKDRLLETWTAHHSLPCVRYGVDRIYAMEQGILKGPYWGRLAVRISRPAGRHQHDRQPTEIRLLSLYLFSKFRNYSFSEVGGLWVEKPWWVAMLLHLAAVSHSSTWVTSVWSVFWNWTHSRYTGEVPGKQTKGRYHSIDRNGNWQWSGQTSERDCQNWPSERPFRHLDRRLYLFEIASTKALSGFGWTLGPELEQEHDRELEQ